MEALEYPPAKSFFRVPAVVVALPTLAQSILLYIREVNTISIEPHFMAVHDMPTNPTPKIKNAAFLRIRCKIHEFIQSYALADEFRYKPNNFFIWIENEIITILIGFISL